MPALGVFSFLGDSVQAGWSKEAPTDSRLNRNASESLNFKGLGLDMIALRSARDVLQRAAPASKVTLFRAPTELTPAEQRAVVEGAQNAALPAWLVKTLNENKLTHLLLVTRSRGNIDASTLNGHDIGRGTVEGIGFYMDTLYTVRNVETGALSTGLLAPYVQIRLTLMDAMSGDIVASADIREAFTYASSEGNTKAAPWEFMPGEKKVTTLRGMVEKGMTRGVENLLSRR